MFLIFGKGKSGLAASELLGKKRIPHFLVDDKTPNWESLLNKVSTVVVSPGIKPTHKVFKLSKELNKELIGETELAYRFWKGKIIAITGTDGKSTTTTLVYEILKAHLKDVYIGGNIGIPFSEIVSKTDRGIAVLEVSSFQGYTLKTFRPHIGVFLNFSEDHLDWHRDLNDYLRGKYKIFQNQREEDFLILNGEWEDVKNIPSKAQKIFFNTPEGEIKIASDGWVYFKETPLFEVSKLKLKGKHNIWNSAVAATVGVLYGVPLKVIREVLYSFKSLPYRLSYVGTFNGVEVYNDSKSTTPNALKAALEAFDQPVVLIFGGKDKGANFKPLRGIFKEKVKFAIAYGENALKLKEQLGDTVSFKAVNTLEEAIKEVKNLLREGDILLFSPASASFDQFSSYEERGRIFNELVKKYF
jgi:UDP-N-acetylmuramoylalanine--D-glutamate ligase